MDIVQIRHGVQAQCTYFLFLVPCPNLVSPANGNVTVTLSGTSATYSCDAGFNLNGEAIVNCLPSGVWDNTPPTCYSITGRTLTRVESNLK